MNEIEMYIGSFTGEVQERLKTVYSIVREKAPDAVESMSYGMPAFKTHARPLVYFAAFPNHIGFYATPSGHAEFAAELSQYKQGKGSVQFPHKQPLPADLIARMVEFRVWENEDKAAKKNKKGRTY
ncbi:MAG: DUF1801 domain-containing protein [Bacteroidales bacterium]|nr:DUF1801 domain-containing protein [Bacteroidales bacterium]